MPKRIVKTSIQVQREGQLVFPPVGEVFDFTNEEVTEINKLAPKALGKIEAPAKEEAAKARADTAVKAG